MPKKVYAPLSEGEKNEIREEYIRNIERFNESLKNKNVDPIPLDLVGLEKRLNDPKEVEIFRHGKELSERDTYRVSYATQFKKTHPTPKQHIMARDWAAYLDLSGTPEAEKKNDEFFSEYQKDPIGVSKQHLLNIMNLDFEKITTTTDPTEQLDLLDKYAAEVNGGFNSTFCAGELGKHDGGLTFALSPIQSILQMSICLKTPMTGNVGNFFFTVPKVSQEQAVFLAQDEKLLRQYEEMSDELSRILQSQLMAGIVVTENSNVFKKAKEMGLDTSKGFPIRYKAVVKKEDGSDKEVKLEDVINGKIPGATIEKRSPQEIDKMLYVTNGAYVRGKEANFKKVYEGKLPIEKDPSFENVKGLCKPGFWETIGFTTSPQYKEFIKAFDGFREKGSPLYGDSKTLLEKGRAYIEYKKTQFGDDLAGIDKKGRDRVDFINGVIKSCETNLLELQPNEEELQFTINGEDIKIEGIDELENDVNLDKDIKYSENIHEKEEIDTSVLDKEDDLQIQ